MNLGLMSTDNNVERIIKYLTNPKRCEEMLRHTLLFLSAFQTRTDKRTWFNLWFVHEIEGQKYLLN